MASATNTLELAIKRDLTHAVRWIVARAVGQGVLYAAVLRRAVLSAFLVIVLGLMLGA
ncbi:MAG TPA: hypothetical protein VFQ53_03435 [Kofleriaceae bacterium]|nr:hypothetical protein [Kofleriaceae bacterium]